MFKIGHKVSKKTRRKISRANSGINNGMYGKHHSNKIREIISKHNKGKILTKKHKKNISKGRKNIKFSKLHRFHLSKAKKGHRVSEETKNKISNTMIKKGINKGKNNSSYGKYGKKAFHYIHGKSKEPYSMEFNDKLKTNIRDRDNHICQLCNISEKKYREKYYRNLDIHHIDYDKQNNEKTNLITLCNSCNIKANFDVDYWYSYYLYKIKDIKRNHISSRECTSI